MEKQKGLAIITGASQGIGASLQQVWQRMVIGWY